MTLGRVKREFPSLLVMREGTLEKAAELLPSLSTRESEHRGCLWVWEISQPFRVL